MTSWVLIEILSRPGLIDRIRAEISRAITIDQKTGLTVVNIPVLIHLPLLCSVYSECLRLRNSVQVVRQLRNDVRIDGYTLKAGNLIIAPSYLAHQDSSAWSNGTGGYPAHEFWPERFLHRSKTVESGNYFPYGGGTAACPGRYYAKQEILAAVALVIAKFDFEPMHFVNGDDTISDRGPRVGTEARGVARIDRDLLVRMRRRSPES
jgi:cytochrome P450